MRVSLSFEVHQPYRINRNFKPEYAQNKEELMDVYFKNSWNEGMFRKVAEKCYYPATRIMMEKLDEYPQFEASFSFSGIFVEQCEKWDKDLLDLFAQLVEKKNVEILGQTYHHSLAGLFEDKQEFMDQVKLHSDLMQDLFHTRPTVFENTELVYNDSIARAVESMGFDAIFAEGAERIMGPRNPNHIYKLKDGNIRLLLRNYKLSDDLAFRFSSWKWEEFPLTANKYAQWIKEARGSCINLFIDYETFGEHHWKESGIFEFLKWIPGEILNEGIEFALPSELALREPIDEVSVSEEETLSWADIEKDSSAWIGNSMQKTCFDHLEKAQKMVERTGDSNMLDVWRYLQVSDNLYYMYTKEDSPGTVHSYFSQQSPFEVFSAYMRILSDLYSKCVDKLEEPLRSAGHYLRPLPPEKGLSFYYDETYANIVAYSMDELIETLRIINEGHFNFHNSAGDFSKWIKYIIGDKILLERINNLEDKKMMREVVKQRSDELWKHFE
ncbi:MAG: glycoside hydrolase family 57 protein [Archaeoglobaceae archaeon]